MNPSLQLKLKCAVAAAAAVVAGQAAAQITFYEHDGFRGRAFTTDKRVGNFERFGFNDTASSVVVERGRWEVCEDARFEGRCMVLRRGSYASLRDMGLNDRVSSVRPVEDRGSYRNEAPVPVAVAPSYAYRRRPQERIHEVPITSARAVMGPPTQQCWMEREQVSQSNPNVGGAVVGALIGGVLGHQVGGGTGRDVATAGGAVAGAAIGANVGGGTPASAIRAMSSVARIRLAVRRPTGT